MKMLTIDGSMGEGGGQILRSALALSLITGTPFRLEKIRASRKKPGLLRQHLTAVNAAAEIGQARVEGAELGSSQVTFHPGTVRPGRYSFAVGTAGSATLVLQTVLPALLRASGPSELELQGGTHNQAAPPFDFLERTFLPVINRMGPRVEAKLHRYGFYPAGGGRFTASITPCAALKPVELLRRGEIRRRLARALTVDLPKNIGARELHVIKEKMGWEREHLSLEEISGAPCPGNIVMVELESDALTEVFTGFGERGVPAEQVADSVVSELRRYLAADVPVGEHLADQLLLPLALGGGGAFRTLPLSSHATTNIEVIRRFLEVDIQVEREENRCCLVRVGR